MLKNLLFGSKEKESQQDDEDNDDNNTSDNNNSRRRERGLQQPQSQPQPRQQHDRGSLWYSLCTYLLIG